LVSEQVFELSNALPGPACFISADGKIIGANLALARLLGLSVEALKGRALTDLVLDSPRKVEDYLHSCSESTTVISTSLLFRTQRDEQISCHCEGSAIKVSSSSAQPLIFLRLEREEGGARETARLKLRIEELRESEALYRALFETTLDGIMIVDDQGYYVEVNESLCRMLKTSREQLIGAHFSQFIPPAVLKEAETDFAELKSFSAFEGEFPMMAADGQVIELDWISRGNFVPGLHFCVAREITERKRAREELERSEEKYRSLLENANDIIYSHDFEGNYLTINRAGAEATGYTRERILGGLNIAQVVAPEHLELAREMTLRKLQDPSPTVYEVDIITKDQRRLTLEVSTRIAYKDGQAVAVEGVARDVTRRKRAEASQRFLAEASALIASSLDYGTTLASVARMAVPDMADWCAVDLLETDGSLKRLAVAHVDPAKVEWAHELEKRYPHDMNAQRGIPNVLRTSRSEIYPEITDEMLVAGARDEEHLRLMRDVGFASAMIVPLVLQGRTLGVITFIYAESKRHYLPEDLVLAEILASRAAIAIENARLYRSAQEANRLKDEFLAIVSHELRTPLTAILGWATILRTQKLDEQTSTQALETIERNAKSQSQIIEDLLDVSRIISGKLRLDIRQVEPVSFIEAAVESVLPAAQAKGIRLQKILDTSLSPVSGDPARLQQIIWNLLANAIKFTPKGGRVQIRLERINSHIEITVSDNGQGISAEFLPFVFDRFRQADSTTTRQHGGLGLGLAIVRHLVELHGGAIRAESPGEGLGATFTVILPLMSVYQKSFTDGSERAATDDSPYLLECPENLNGLKILAVDDEVDTRELLRIVLTDCGAEVTVVASARDALEQLENFKPDILISDIGMPDEDGYSLIQKVRELPKERGGNIPAIALTAYARAEDRLRILRSGFQMHVPKPVELEELVAVVASLMQRREPS
jgi:PAS domain S-box-containing protein